MVQGQGSYLRVGALEGRGASKGQHGPAWHRPQAFSQLDFNMETLPSQGTV
jgi:hypothetical protein